jgi:predicted DNA-binding transcriptional regulator AlpA
MPSTKRAKAPDDLMPAGPTAELLNMSLNNLYVLRSRAARGEGAAPPAYRIGRRLLFSRSEVLEWIAERREKVPATP